MKSLRTGLIIAGVGILLVAGAAPQLLGLFSHDPLIVAGGSPKTTIKVKVPKAKVQNTAIANVFNTTFWSRNVAVVVVDIDRQGLAMVHNLHTVFPQVRIVAVTKDPAKLMKARRFGAAAVVLAGSGDTNQIVSAAVSSLLGRV